jgi:hypothetical protein
MLPILSVLYKLVSFGGRMLLCEEQDSLRRKF